MVLTHPCSLPSPIYYWAFNLRASTTCYMTDNAWIKFWWIPYGAIMSSSKSKSFAASWLRVRALTSWAPCWWACKHSLAWAWELVKVSIVWALHERLVNSSIKVSRICKFNLGCPLCLNDVHEWLWTKTLESYSFVCMLIHSSALKLGALYTQAFNLRASTLKQAYNV